MQRREKRQRKRQTGGQRREQRPVPGDKSSGREREERGEEVGKAHLLNESTVNVDRRFS